MEDSEIPAFTTKILNACRWASKSGLWRDPKPPGEYNWHCCPLKIYCQQGNCLTLDEQIIASSFMRGYDLCEGHNVAYDLGNEERVLDRRFYILGQGFRKIAETTRFSNE